MNSTNTSTSVVVHQQWQHQVIIFINTYVLFCQILFGCSGNVLNLVVLLSRKMRSRTNLKFAIHKSQRYRDSRFLIRGILNWFSAISIWSMMYATIERVQVFRSPFRTSRRSVSPRFLANIAFIVIASLAVTAQTFAPPSILFPAHIEKLLLVLHAVSVVVIPLVVCSLLNILLVLALKKNTMPIQMLKDSQSQQTLLEARNKTERKVLNFVLFCMSSDHFRALLRQQLVCVFDCTNVTRRSSCRSATKTYSIPLHDV
ncbi:unnamed protein product [Heligmosomoides polygyrus]|uniref:G_PROTEIN_RECEP_F1_2 domain-containing protein n=1 Tax=Heligmosomoides polygyrus TaxID=6339 RepID=A0A3P7Z8M2_HELPZ|nr:unnamed protein product [Heligmosomoides polygyrus]